MKRLIVRMLLIVIFIVLFSPSVKLAHAVTTESYNPEPLTSVNIGVILFYFQNSTNPEFPEEIIQEIMFDGHNSVKTYYEEVSFQQLSLTGTVFNWVEIPFDMPNSGNVEDCNKLEWAEAAKQTLQNMEVNLDDYTNFYYISSDTVSGCGHGVSFADAGYSNGFSNVSQYIFTHELGHAFGLNHANFLDCGSKSIDVYSQCSESEYSDPYGVMGTEYTHLNGINKMILGWIPYSSVQEITTTGSYVLSSVSSSETGAPQILKVPKPDTREYYILEYHHSVGYDASLRQELLDGTSIRIWNNSKGRSTRLLDPILASGHSSTSRPVIYDDEIFIDEINQIQIKQVSHTVDGTVLEIQASPNTEEPYTISGNYVDENNNPISLSGLGVTIRRLDGSGYTVEIDNAPTWSINDLEIGFYSITANTIPNYEITSSSCSGCDFFLNYSGGQTTMETFAPTSSALNVSFKYTQDMTYNVADINEDGVVDITDYSFLVIDFFQSQLNNPRSDINQDGVVDISDYSLLVLNFFKT